MIGVVIAAFVAVWCLAPLPLAVAVGRSFRAGEADDNVPVAAPFA